MRAGDALLHTRLGPQPLQLRVADRFLSRFVGLMFSRELADRHGLLITRCSSVHSGWMRYAIDLAYLDLSGQVLGCVSHLKPWRASLGPRGSAHVLELPCGSIAGLDLAVGDRLEHPSLQSSKSS